MRVLNRFQQKLKTTKDLQEWFESTAKKHAPRGFRRNINPGWNEKAEQLNKQSLENGIQTLQTSFYILG